MKLTEEQLATVPAEEKITVKGKVYAFNEPTLGLVKRAKKFFMSSPLSKPEGMNADPDTDEWKNVCEDWRKFCEMIFQNPDEGLGLDDLRPEKEKEILDSFFVSLKTPIRE